MEETKLTRRQRTLQRIAERGANDLPVATIDNAYAVAVLPLQAPETVTLPKTDSRESRFRELLKTITHNQDTGQRTSFHDMEKLIIAMENLLTYLDELKK